MHWKGFGRVGAGRSLKLFLPVFSQKNVKCTRRKSHNDGDRARADGSRTRKCPSRWQRPPWAGVKIAAVGLLHTALLLSRVALDQLSAAHRHGASVTMSRALLRRRAVGWPFGHMDGPTLARPARGRVPAGCLLRRMPRCRGETARDGTGIERRGRWCVARNTAGEAQHHQNNA